MVQGAVVELIIGINTDPLFGQYLVLGAGGILVDVLQDAQSVLLPTNKYEVKRVLSNLKCVRPYCWVTEAKQLPIWTL